MDALSAGKLVVGLPWKLLSGALVSWAESRRRKRHNLREWRRRLLHVRHLCDSLEERILMAAKTGNQGVVRRMLSSYLSEATEGNDLKNVIDAGSIDWVDPTTIQAYVTHLEPIPMQCWLGMRTLKRASFAEYETEHTAKKAKHWIDARRYAVARFCEFVGTRGEEIYAPS